MTSKRPHDSNAKADTEMNDRMKIESVAAAETGAKILVFGAAREKLDAIARVLKADGDGGLVSTSVGATDQLAAAVARADPDLLIVLLPDAGLPVLEQVDRLGHLYTRMTPILLCNQQSPEFLMEAMRVGIREVLPLDAPPDVLRSAVSRFSQKRTAAPGQNGKVIAFMSCKGGGGGATFLATNLAYALAEVEHKRVILIDLNLQWGDAAFFVTEKKPASTLADVASQIHRVDAAFLASSLVNAHPLFGILAAPEDPVQALEVKAEHIDVLIRLARNNYDFVILDAGRALDGVTIRALDNADVVYPVIQMSLPFIRDGKRLMEAFRSLGYADEKVKLIVNRYEKKGDVRLEEMEQAVGVKAVRTLPNDYAAVSASINQGMPVVVLAPNSSVARSIREFAQDLVATPRAETGGWFARMIRRA
jgi:pilus assembly protein CpaE